MNIEIILGHLSEWIGVIAVTLLLSLNTRYIKRPLVFKYPRREAGFALGLYAFILIAAFLFYFRLPVTIEGSLAQVLIPRLLLAGVSLLPFAAALRLRFQPMLSTGWNRRHFKVAGMLGIALALLTIFLRGKFHLMLGTLGNEQWLSLPLWLGICLFEETIFRGYLQPRLSSYWNIWAGWIITALMFLLWTLPRLLMTPDTLYFNLTFILVQGLLLGWVARKSGHVASPIIYRAVSEWLLLL